MGSQFLEQLVKPFHQRSQAPANPVFDQTATLFPSLRLLIGGKQAFLVFIPQVPYLNTWEAGCERESSSLKAELASCFVASKVIGKIRMKMWDCSDAFRPTWLPHG